MIWGRFSLPRYNNFCCDGSGEGFQTCVFDEKNKKIIFDLPSVWSFVKCLNLVNLHKAFTDQEMKPDSKINCIVALTVY